MDGSMDEWKDRWINGSMEEWMDRCMDGRVF